MISADSNEEKKQPFYKQLKQALQTARDSGKLEELLSSSWKDGEFSASITGTTVMSLIVTQKSSGGELLKFVVESLPSDQLVQLITKEVIADFVEEEYCAEPEPLQERLEDVRMRAELLYGVNSDDVIERAIAHGTTVLSRLMQDTTRNYEYAGLWSVHGLQDMGDTAPYDAHSRARQQILQETVDHLESFLQSKQTTKPRPHTAG